MIVALNTRFQIAAACFFVVFILNYWRYKRLPIITSRIFNVIACVGALNLVFDIITVYTVNNLDTVPAWLNRLCHQIFIGSLDLIIALLYIYVAVLGHSQKRPKGLKGLVIIAPVSISLIMVFVGPLYYYKSPNGSYSYGPMANTVYASVVIYLIMILYNTRHFSNDQIGRQKKIAIRISLGLWVGAAAIQMIRHDLLMSGLAEVLMLYFIYFAFENQRETMELEIGCRNEAAFRVMTIEQVEVGKPFTIVSVVFDDILQIYRQYGHQIGHSYLTEISKRLKYIYGPFIFRSKGNVMSVFVQKNQLPKLESMLQQTRQILECPLVIGEIQILKKFHIDVLQCPEYADSYDDICNIIDYMSEYESEENAEIIHINRKMIEETKRILTIEAMLVDALENDGFEVFYQPIYHPLEAGFLSAEALLRLKDRTTIGYVSPEEFIPIAEKRGMIMKIGMIVFEKVCIFAQKHNLQDYDVQYIEVNLSGVQCQSKTLASELRQIMQQYDIQPRFIGLEITETAAISAGKTLYRNMKELKQSGVTFAMDDFGTGYSNLAQMVEVAYEFIKLDKTLVWPAFEKDNDKARILLEEVIDMVQRLGISIIAEGVETKEQAEWLAGRQVAHLQGYYFSRPVCEQEYLEFIKTNRKAG